jgi:hypothetical protein
MYLDLGDNHPDTPRVPSVISVREGVLLSLVLHMAIVIAILLKPDVFFAAKQEPVPQVVAPAAREAIRYVDMRPLRDIEAPPPRPAEQSDMDRRSATRERPPNPQNANPFSRGNTPEKIEGGPPAQPPAAPPPSPPAAETAAAPPLADEAGRVASLQPAPVAAPPRPPSQPTLGQSLRNLEQYLRTERFDNQQGGATDTYSDIQFDSKGIDFGPWLRRFKAQVERNWIVPDVAMNYRGRTVIQFFVLKNGFIVGLNVVQPAGIPALTTSALSALKLSNPTAKLPEEYPDDRVFFTVTFHYNEYDRNTP